MTNLLTMNRRSLFATAGLGVLAAPFVLRGTAFAQANQPQTSMKVDHAMKQIASNLETSKFSS